MHKEQVFRLNQYVSMDRVYHQLAKC